MAFNLFKRKKQEEVQPVPEKQVPKLKETELPEKKPARPGPTQPETEGTAPQKSKKNMSALPGVLFHPHITEKATMLGERGQYVFRVHPKATKSSVRQSVEALYGVSVRSIRLIKKPAKKIRVGRREGIQQGLKKAVVQLKAGESIEVISR